MLEKNRVTGSEINFCHRYDLTFHLATAGAELELRHVLDARSFAPSRLADQIANVERRTAGAASESSLVVHTLAPLALNAFYRRSSGVHRTYDINSNARERSRF